MQKKNVHVIFRGFFILRWRRERRKIATTLLQTCRRFSTLSAWVPTNMYRSCHNLVSRNSYVDKLRSAWRKFFAGRLKKWNTYLVLLYLFIVMLSELWCATFFSNNLQRALLQKKVILFFTMFSRSESRFHFYSFHVMSYKCSFNFCSEHNNKNVIWWREKEKPFKLHQHYIKWWSCM